VIAVSWLWLAILMAWFWVENPETVNGLIWFAWLAVCVAAADQSDVGAIEGCGLCTMRLIL
jgi:hypothetical protein